MPSDSLHKEHACKCVDWGFLKDVVVIRDMCTGFGRQVVVGASTRDEVFITFNGHGRFVVSMVRGTPGVIGDQNKLERTQVRILKFYWIRMTNCVQRISDDMVNPAEVGKTTMSSFVRQAPPSRQDNALPVPVERPEAPFDKRPDSRRNAIVINERIGKRINHPSEFVNYHRTDNVAENISKGLECVPLVKMLRDNCMNFGQCSLKVQPFSGRRTKRNRLYIHCSACRGCSCA